MFVIFVPNLANIENNGKNPSFYRSVTDVVRVSVKSICRAVRKASCVRALS